MKTDKELKLFVIGHKSPNPEDWSIWSEVSLAIAHSKEEIIEKWLGGWDDKDITEIKFDKPKFLVSMPEPAWGDDI